MEEHIWSRVEEGNSVNEAGMRATYNNFPGEVEAV